MIPSSKVAIFMLNLCNSRQIFLQNLGYDYLEIGVHCFLCLVKPFLIYQQLSIIQLMTLNWQFFLLSRHEMVFITNFTQYFLKNGPQMTYNMIAIFVVTSPLMHKHTFSLFHLLIYIMSGYFQPLQGHYWPILVKFRL